VGRQPLPTNTILGNGSDQYRIDTVLGPGGFGVTYLARDMRFERDVAIKEYFPAEFAYRDGSTTIRSSTRGNNQNFFEQGKRYFLDEARTLAKFRHEHIVRVLNLFEQFNTAYMVLEFEEGHSLKSWLRSLGRRPTQRELDDILNPLLAALEAVHAKGMFHRDIAPDNVIIRPSGKPVLIDFGAARHFVREHSHTLGAIVKHGYSPPEQYTLDTKLQGAWSDIYSLSATIYSALMGEPPEEASRRQLNDTLLPIEQHLEPAARDLYRPSFFAALNAGLALRPRDRPQTVAAFRALLEGRAPAESRPLNTANGHDDASASASGGGERRTRPEAASSRGGGQPASGPARLSRPTAGEGALVADIADRPARVSSPGPAQSGQEAHNFADSATEYPEGAARIAGGVALAVAAFAAAAFLSIGGIAHPGGLAAAMLVCAGVVATGAERTLSVARAAAADVRGATVAAAVMATLALAVFWLPFFFWQVSAVLVVIAGFFALVQLGRWVPVTLLGLALVHLAIAALLLALATRSVQRDPYFLPLMGTSLAALAALVLASALQIQRRWEAAAP
jgi:serine/threonine protein kinase